MATPRQVTLGIFKRKNQAVIGAGSTADANVIVEFDKDMNAHDVVVTLEQIKEKILEEEY